MNRESPLSYSIQCITFIMNNLLEIVNRPFSSHILCNYSRRWNEIAAYLPKRTGSHVRNYWTTKRRKRLTMKMGMNAHENSYMGDSNSTITVTNHQDNNMMNSTSPNSSWMMENSNACSMFNHENSYMGNSSSTIIVTSHQDNNMMNSTSPNSSCIDHLIDYPTLPLSLDESTYANTGCCPRPH